MENKGYYAVIPAEVRYAEIPNGAKLLYGEITSLCNAEGYCWASNTYFSNLYGVSTRSIVNWINCLEKNGFINREIVLKDGKKEVDKRIITITPMKKFSPPSENNFTTPSEKNFTENNKSINKKENTISNEIVKEKVASQRFSKPTAEEIEAYCRERNNGIDAQYFFDYYEARNWELAKGRKVKDWKACVRTWERNEFNKSKKETNPKTNKFNNFEQRSYDFDALEKKLIRGG